MRLGWVQIAGTASGGHQYGAAARAALAAASGAHGEQVTVTVEDIRSGAGVLRPIVMEARLRALRRRGRYDALVLDNAVALTFPLPPKPKHIVVVYHLGLDSISKGWVRTLLGAVEPFWLRHLRAADQVVTICKFWEQRVRALGNPRVRTIYNAYDPADFQVSDDEVAAFRARHGFTKPIMYIGNCQEAKGARESFEALRDLDVHLVTSGQRLLDLPARHLELPQREYLCLLRASAVVVTMSKFDEGWCRVAHEAMMLGRPVVGSGRGGMGELLAGGKQAICPLFADLRGHVQGLLDDPARAESTGEAGRVFAQSFTPERFRSDWAALVSAL